MATFVSAVSTALVCALWPGIREIAGRSSISSQPCVFSAASVVPDF
jgi:hypothetical protein